MTTMLINTAEGADNGALEDELVTAMADRLRDEHGYELGVERGDQAGAEHEYPLSPSGGIVVRHRDGTLTVKLRGVDVDAHDLFTGVGSELEQRHDGLHVELR